MKTREYTVKEIGSFAENAQKGTPEAEAELYEAIMERMTLHAYKCLNDNNKNMANAEDIFQDTFIRCMGKIDKLNNPQLFVKWFSAAIYNSAMSWNKYNNSSTTSIDEIVRKEDDNKHNSKLDRITYQLESQQSCDDDKEEKIQKMMQAMQQIKPEQQQVLDLFYLQGKSYTEICKMTGLKQSTVVGRIQTGKKAVLQAMQKEL